MLFLKKEWKRLPVTRYAAGAFKGSYTAIVIVAVYVVNIYLANGR